MLSFNRNGNHHYENTLKGLSFNQSMTGFPPPAMHENVTRTFQFENHRQLES